LSQESIEDKHAQKFVKREEETSLSHKSNQRGDYTQSKDANAKRQYSDTVLKNLDNELEFL